MSSSKPKIILVVGLGNPGEEYEKTRHNAGRNAVIKWQKKEGLRQFSENSKQRSLITEGRIGGTKVITALPETFMNKSGVAVAALVKYYKIKPDAIVVVHDDADLPLGTLKIVFNRGSGGHKGVKSVMRALKTEAFVRIRIGIGKNMKWHERDLNKLVIAKFTPLHQTQLNKALKKTIEALTVVVREGYERAMNEYNT
ncbi:MAG: aminoacyl-tRNA hydrolase [Candidatus Terrybacteria bacterium RIFCSPHIGHO2_01_FULL_48_17]|uniref:Peptidyl-tRNA hydrolase n=1 Tax=Candidatus Terrybacteria bacterium RIFCSPHIGHO2_01_FULL_48_17 TaxID=1802362 RepID=A0A1G2PHH3_9BACT|nr:MAG: aminoacyl-tRNA hydrolase [Candidatus Terrybacteria bacterium RIFCSPHIGHO2_01_FULL_48_17]